MIVSFLLYLVGVLNKSCLLTLFIPCHGTVADYHGFTLDIRLPSFHPYFHFSFVDNNMSKYQCLELGMVIDIVNCDLLMGEFH